MATVTLDLNDDLVAELGSRALAGDVARIVALQLFRDGKVSLAKAAEFALTPLEEFKVFARLHGERPPDWVAADEPERERRALEYLESLNLPAPPWTDCENRGSALTLEELNQEIAASRRERRQRQISQ